MQRLCIALGFACLLVAPSYGTIIGIGSSVVPPDIFSSNPSITVLATTGTRSFSTDGGNVTGTYVEVVASDPSNPFCAGCLDFGLQVSVNSSSTASIDTLRFGQWGGYTTDVGYVSNSGGLAPGTVFRGSGNNIGFNFSSLAPGASTDVLVVETNARFYDELGSVFVTPSDSTSSILTIGPAFVTAPEPTTVSMIGLGILGLAAFRKKLVR